MRNASDIFCLNEDLTDGNEMFSINGSCPMRLRRRPIPQQNDCFEYGRSNIDKYEGGDAETERKVIEALDLSEGCPDQDIDKSDTPRSVLNSTRPPSECSAVTDNNNPDIPESIQQDKTPSEFSVITNRNEKRNGGNRKTKNVRKNEPDNVSISNMSRNPLTGAGMEIEQHRKPKKGLGNKNDKWVW
ncbi:uncharacterized protein LOC130892927 [Diorhabda carinulata]|uniref:uncharacterized protein LOC130892927 n=1 Tax=Diorhabda carinulata TaxID=1163345 RepID=UPI0025A1C9ED|nr:uncharacterized protein LOC130892927 [Diorhabda carinulata]